MISTADDLNKFFSYLLSGKLLKEQQLKQMLTTVPTGIAEIGRYGLGIYETKLPNGVSIWGHAGASRVFYFCWRHTWRQAYIGHQFEWP